MKPTSIPPEPGDSSLAEARELRSRLPWPLGALSARSAPPRERIPGAIVAALLILTGVLAFKSPVFLSAANFTNIARGTALVTIVALGQTVVLIGGGIDLSVGSIAAMGGVATGSALVHGAPAPLAIGIGIGMGVLCGVINGWLIVRLSLSPLIVTLGTMSIFFGFVLYYTQGRSIVYPSGKLAFLGSTSLGPLPLTFLIMVFLAFLLWMLLTQTVFGPRIYAIGASEQAAEASGVHVRRIKFETYILCGTLAATAGVLLAAELFTSQASGGTDYLLPSIAAAVIGGVAVSGGIGSIWGAVLGGWFVTEIHTGLVLTGSSPYTQGIVVGAIIVASVSLNRWTRQGAFSASIARLLSGRNGSGDLSA